MEVDYNVLQKVSQLLVTAATTITDERAASIDLGSGVATPNGAYSAVVSQRKQSLDQFAELLNAQSKACNDIAKAFTLLDAQIASTIGQ